MGFQFFYLTLQLGLQASDFHMEHHSHDQRDKDRLLSEILPFVLKNGLKATTMDKVASALSMSKRTLYEIFDSKEEMIKGVLSYLHRKHSSNIKTIFEKSDTVIEAFYYIFKSYQEIMDIASADFYRDMDVMYSQIRNVYDAQTDAWQQNMLATIATGQQQGVFRDDVNYPVILRMFRVQMESLKRMEEFLPNDVTIQEAYQTVIMSFLRSIASQKGMEILEKAYQGDKIKK